MISRFALSYSTRKRFIFVFLTLIELGYLKTIVKFCLTANDFIEPIF